MLLLFIAPCAALLPSLFGKVANGILGTLHSKQHYWEDGIKFGK